MFRSEDEAAGYLAGMIDGEGCVTYERRGNGLRRSVRISNTNRELIDACIAACEYLGIEATVQTAGPSGERLKPCWYVYIGRTSNLRVLERKVSLRDSGKRDRLRQAAVPPAKWTESWMRATEAQRLRAEGMPHKEIAQKLGCSVQTSFRYAGGINRGWKLSETDVRDIRQLLQQGWVQRDIAGPFGVSDSQISQIKHRITRANVAQASQAALDLEAAV